MYMGEAKFACRWDKLRFVPDALFHVLTIFLKQGIRIRTPSNDR